MRCLAIDPEDRPQSIAEVEQLLLEIDCSWTQANAETWWRRTRETGCKPRAISQIAETVDLSPGENEPADGFVTDATVDMLTG